MFGTKKPDQTEVTPATPTPPESKSLFKFVRRWQELVERYRTLGYDVCAFFRDLRKQFPTGADVLEGDEQFKTWCIANLKIGLDGKPLSDFNAKKFLSYAIAGSVFKSDEDLSNAGGIKALEEVIVLPRPEQITIMQGARSALKNIGTVKRERGHATPRVKVTPVLDAKKLAEYIQKAVPDPPPPIREIMARYVKLSGK